MYKYLNFQIRKCAFYLLYIGKGCLSGKYYAGYPLFLIKPCGKVVGNILLSGKMEGKIWKFSVCYPYYPWVRDYYTIYLYIMQKIKIVPHLIKFIIFKIGVQGNIYFFSYTMGKKYPLFHILTGEILCPYPQAKFLSTYIYCICPKGKCIF